MTLNNEYIDWMFVTGWGEYRNNYGDRREIDLICTELEGYKGNFAHDVNLSKNLLVKECNNFKYCFIYAQAHRICYLLDVIPYSVSEVAMNLKKDKILSSLGTPEGYKRQIIKISHKIRDNHLKAVDGNGMLPYRSFASDYRFQMLTYTNLLARKNNGPTLS